MADPIVTAVKADVTKADTAVTSEVSKLKADLAALEAKGKAEIAKIEAENFKFSTVVIVAAASFVAGLLAHLL